MKKNKLFSFGVVKTDDNGKITVVASDETKDRHGEIVKVKGWDLQNFKKNPTMLIGHNYQDLPVGKWNKTRVEEKELLVEPEFANTDKGNEVEELDKSGILPAVSVGFMVKKRNEEDPSIIEEAELLEVSWVSVPANPSALIQSSYKGYKFDMKLDKEAKDIEKLLAHYREVLPEYRKLLKKLNKLYAIDVDGIDIKEGKQIENVMEKVLLGVEKLSKKKTDKANPDSEAKASENQKAMEALVKAFGEKMDDLLEKYGVN